MSKLTSQLHKRHIAAGVILVLADGLFFGITNPARVPSAVLIIGFVLVALTMYGVLRLLLAIAAFYGLPMASHGKRVALFIGIAGAIALALQSLGELSPRDVVVLALLSVLAYVYVSYGRNQC
jgi:hypothetical protein